MKEKLKARLKSLFSVNALLLMLGYSFFRSASYNSYVTNFATGEGAYGYISNLPFLIGASAGILIAVILIFILARTRMLRALELSYLAPILIFALCYAIGPLFTNLLKTDLFLSQQGLGLIWGITTTTVTLVWIELLTYEESPLTLILQLACSSLFSAIIGVLLTPFPQIISIVACVVLALIGIPIIRKCRRDIQKSGAQRAGQQSDTKQHESKQPDTNLPASKQPDTNQPATMQPDTNQPRARKQRASHGVFAVLKSVSTMILAYCFFELVVGMINMFAYEGSSSFDISTNAPVQALFICSILIVLIVLITSKAPSSSFIYLFIIPLCITIFLVLPFFGESMGRPLSSVIYSAYVFTSMLTLFTYIRAIRKEHADTYQVAAIVIGSVRIMLMVGIGMGYGFSSMLEAETYVQLSIVAVSAVYLLGVIVLLWSYLNTKKKSSQAREAAPASPTKSYEEIIADRVEELVARHGLTNRERDMLIGLSRGNSAARIAEDLFISTSTAQGYIKTLYVKIGVNKKQQVLDLFDVGKGANEANGAKESVPE